MVLEDLAVQTVVPEDLAVQAIMPEDLIVNARPKNFLDDIIVVKEFVLAGEYKYLKNYHNISPKLLLAWNLNYNFFQNTEILDHVINFSDDENVLNLLFNESIKRGADIAVLHIANSYIKHMSTKTMCIYICILLRNRKNIIKSSVLTIFKHLLTLDIQEICDIKDYRIIFATVATIFEKKYSSVGADVMKILLEHLEKKSNVADIFTQDFYCDFSNVQKFPHISGPDTCRLSELLTSDIYLENNNIVKKFIDISIPVDPNPKYLRLGINVVNRLIERKIFTDYTIFIIERLWNIRDDDMFKLLFKIIRFTDLVSAKQEKILQMSLNLDNNLICNSHKYRELLSYCVDPVNKHYKLHHFRHILTHLEKKENVVQVFNFQHECSGDKTLFFQSNREKIMFFQKLADAYNNDLITDETMSKMIRMSLPIDSETSEFKNQMEIIMAKKNRKLAWCTIS